MSFFHVLFSPAGRIRRRDYWAYSIGFGLAVLLIQYLIHRFVFALQDDAFLTDYIEWTKGNFTPYSVTILAISALSIYPGFCIAVKRWHDRNRPALIQVLFLIWSYGTALLQSQLGDPTQPKTIAIVSALGIINFGLGIWAFVECGCLDGTYGPNRYGPSPKGRGASPAAVF